MRNLLKDNIELTKRLRILFPIMLHKSFGL